MRKYCPVHRIWIDLPTTAPPPYRCHMLVNEGIISAITGKSAASRCDTELTDTQWKEVDPDKLNEYINDLKAAAV